MTPEQLNELVREQGPYVFDRMFSAVEKVRERMERACGALEKSNVSYAVVGGNAVAAWVATKDDGAVRNTQDVDLLLKREEFNQAIDALKSVGFHYEKIYGIDTFLDGTDGKPSQGLHIIWAEETIKVGENTKAPRTEQFQTIDGKRILDLQELVQMKLLAYRLKDRVHLLDLIGVGLVDGTWPARFPAPFAERLHALLDNPDG